MLNITLPDGSRRQFEAPVSVYDVAASIEHGAGQGRSGGQGRRQIGGYFICD